MSIINVKDRLPTNVLSNKAVRYGVYDENNNLLRYEYIKREDEPAEEGTAINKSFFDELQTKGIGYNKIINYEKAINGDVFTPESYPDEKVLTTDTIQETSTVTLENGNVVIAYCNKAKSYVAFKIVTENGETIVDETSVNSSIATYIKVELLSNGNFIIGYRDGSDTYGKFVIYNENGELVKGETIFNSGDTAFISIKTIKNGNVCIAYRNGNKGEFKIYDYTGNIKINTVQFEVNVSSASNLTHISLAPLKNGNIFIAYTGYVSAYRGYFVIYDSNGNLIKARTEFQENQVKNLDIITLKNGYVFVAYWSKGSSDYFAWKIYSENGDQMGSYSDSYFVPSYLALTLTNEGEVIVAYTNHMSSNTSGYVVIQESGTKKSSYGLANPSFNTAYISCTTLNNGRILFSFGKINSSSEYTGGFYICGYYSYIKDYKIDGLGKPLEGQTLNVIRNEGFEPVGISDISGNYNYSGHTALIRLKNGNLFYACRSYTNIGLIKIFDRNGNLVKKGLPFEKCNWVELDVLSNGNIAMIYEDVTSTYVNLIIYDEEANIVQDKTTLLQLNVDELKFCVVDNDNLFLAYEYSGSVCYSILKTNGERILYNSTIYTNSYIAGIDCKLLSDKNTVAVTFCSSGTNVVLYRTDGTLVKERNIYDTYGTGKTSIAVLDGKFSIAYVYYNSTLSSNVRYRVYLLLYRNDGSVITSGQVSVTSSIPSPIAIPLNNGNTVVVYEQENTSYGSNGTGGYYMIMETSKNKITPVRINGISDIQFATGTNIQAFSGTPFEDGFAFAYADGTYVSNKPSQDYLSFVPEDGTAYTNYAVNGEKIDTILSNGYYELLYDGEQYIAYKTRVEE